MDLSGKKVAVYGLGVTGLAVLKALESIDLAELVIVNRQKPGPKDYEEISFLIDPLPLAEEESAQKLATMDLILLSPGIPRNKESLKLAQDNQVKIWNEIEWCSNGFAGQVIAVTGTNGKTTTVTFLDIAFRDAGVRVFTGGNIGIPFSSIYHRRQEYDLALLEMSSFQCESLASFKPSIAAYLNLYSNHGERYQSVDEYRLSKWELVRNQTLGDTIFCGPGSGKPNFQIQSSLQTLPEDFIQELSPFIDWSKLKVVGAHNRQNIWFAWKIFAQYFTNIGRAIPKERFLESLYSFHGVEHRVEACPKFDKHLVFNDAKSTNWEATKSAVNAVLEKKTPIVLVIGGQLRGQDDFPPQELIDFFNNNTEKILGIGEASKFLCKKWSNLEDVEDLKGVKTWIQNNAKEALCVLLSPGFPSFDQFKNYGERGEAFKKIFSN